MVTTTQPHRLRIGAVDLAGVAVQAALSGYSDLPMRSVARAHGAPYALHEVVLDEHVLHRGKLQRRILAVPEHDHPVGGQLMGSEPAKFGAAARLLVRAGYDVVDLNFACPVSKVLGRCRGGHLLRDADTALAMVDSVLQAVGTDVPVTVKLRRGFDDGPAAERAFFAVLEGAYARGIAAATVHPRTVVQKYVGPSRWEFLRVVKQAIGDRILLGSGDLFSPFAVRDMLAQTGVDGVAIARGCIGNPFVFAQVEALLTGGVPLRPTLAQQRAALLQHWHAAVQHYGSPRQALPHVRPHAIQYALRHPEPVAARDRIVAVRRPEEFESAVLRVFAVTGDDAAEPLRPEHTVLPPSAA